MLSASKFVDRINDRMKISELDQRGCHRHCFPKCLRAEAVPFSYLYPLCLVCNSLSTTVDEFICIKCYVSRRENMSGS